MNGLRCHAQLTEGSKNESPEHCSLFNTDSYPFKRKDCNIFAKRSSKNGLFEKHLETCLSVGLSL